MTGVSLLSADRGEGSVGEASDPDGEPEPGPDGEPEPERDGSPAADTERSEAASASDEEPDLSTVVALLDDDCARTVLTATSTEPMSATEVAERCGASVSTVYRRAERLREAGLVTERDRLRSDGHHDTVYVATLDRLAVRLDEGRLEFDLETTPADATGATDDDGEDPADRLTRLWEDLR
jgi:DNA-binding transcriptional ArsR family regulator